MTTTTTRWKKSKYDTFTASANGVTAIVEESAGGGWILEFFHRSPAAAYRRPGWIGTLAEAMRLGEDGVHRWGSVTVERVPLSRADYSIDYWREKAAGR